MQFISYFIILICCITLSIHYAQAQAKGAKASGPTRTRVTASQKWIQQSLEIHNYFRSLHQTPPLVLNDTLSEISQYYANRLLEINLGSLDSQGNGKIFFQHNPEIQPAGIGENLYFSSNTGIEPSKEPIPSHYAVLLWYEEIKDYDFNATIVKVTSAPDSKIGHLTQLLWKETTQMGTAYASGTLENTVLTFVVANYYRSGNVHGRKKVQNYLENVLTPTISETEINAAIVSRNIQGWWKEMETKSGTSESWRKAALKSHNKYRALHESQPLRLNKDICTVSQNWADHLLETGLRVFNSIGDIHKIEQNYVGGKQFGLGESSLFFVNGKDKLSPELPVKLWYKQRQNYNFDGSQSKVGLKTDVFQQIVWKSTTEFCISYASGMAENGQYLTYVVANYYPAITFVAGDRNRNIFPSDTNPLDEDGSQGCCSGGAIFAIILIIIFVILMGVFAGYIYKYKYDWYCTILKTVRLKKY